MSKHLYEEIDELHRVIERLNEKADALSAENERLRKALEPFAREASSYDPDEGDGDDSAWMIPAGFRIRDLRAARAALEAKP